MTREVRKEREGGAVEAVEEEGGLEGPTTREEREGFCWKETVEPAEGVGEGEGEEEGVGEGEGEGEGAGVGDSTDSAGSSGWD